MDTDWTIYTCRDFWKFEQSVKRDRRYVRDKQAEEFLQSLRQTSTKRKLLFKKGSILWRSQVGHCWEPLIQDDEHIDDVPGPLMPERMKPLRDRAAEGRVNPKGIPYLYLATNKETAMAEVRPWIGSLISVAQFKVRRNLKVVDCSLHHNASPVFFKELTEEERLHAIWAHVDAAFSRPVSPDDQTADYVATQIIAELFKDQGYDGIVYKSALGDGYNVTLFDIEAADLINCSLYEVKSISFDFKQASNSYFFQRVKVKDDKSGV